MSGGHLLCADRSGTEAALRRRRKMLQEATRRRRKILHRRIFFTGSICMQRLCRRQAVSWTGSDRRRLTAVSENGRSVHWLADRILNKSCSDKFMFMMRVRGGAALQQMHMLSAAHINGRRSCAAEMMGMAVAGICLEGYFVDMTAVTGNGFSRNSGKSMVMGIFTAAGNFYTALYFVNIFPGNDQRFADETGTDSVWSLTVSMISAACRAHWIIYMVSGPILALLSR